MPSSPPGEGLDLAVQGDVDPAQDWLLPVHPQPVDLLGLGEDQHVPEHIEAVVHGTAVLAADPAGEVEAQGVRPGGERGGPIRSGKLRHGLRQVQLCHSLGSAGGAEAGVVVQGRAANGAGAAQAGAAVFAESGVIGNDSAAMEALHIP
jgi:hypothetical protein